MTPGAVYRIEYIYQKGDSRVKKIYLTTGETVLVDDFLFPELNRYSWTNVNGYAARKEGRSTIYMHRQIMNSQPGIQVDHKNGNRLDNQRKNLRHATAAQNMANRRGWGASLYKGVYRQGSKWRALIMHEGKLKSLGSYATDREAAIAWNAAARIIQGEFALLNDVG